MTSTAVFLGILGCSRVGTEAVLEPVPSESVAKPSSAERIADPPDSEWQRMFYKDSEPLLNIPEIFSIQEAPSRHEGQIAYSVTVKNNGTTILEYSSAGRSHIQLFQEIHDSGIWHHAKWDWCGTGKELFEIGPNESVVLYTDFWDAELRERMLANFSEKGTNRSGLVVLVTEP